MLQRSGWTRDIDMFFQWLSAIPFSGGDFNKVAVAEGLDEALMMFSSLNGSQTQQQADEQRHCILVAASNPYSSPTRVYCPAIQFLEQSGNIKAHTSNHLADAETVAKAFPQCSVSLSVICPRKLPKLRAIYNAGKSDPQAADPPIDTSKNPNFLLLISKNFSEACTACSHTEIESLALNQANSSVPSVPLVYWPEATSNPSVRNHQPISAGNILAATVNFEHTTVTSVSGHAPPHIPFVHPTIQVGAGLQSALPIFVSEELVPNNENTKEITPIVSVMTQFLGPFSAAAANVRVLNEVASAIPATSAVLTSGQLGVTSMTGFAPFARTRQIAQNYVPASLTSMALDTSGNSNPCVSQMLSNVNVQGGIGADNQTTPVMSHGNLPWSQFVQSGIGMHQNVPSGMGTCMPLRIGRMIFTPGMTQQGHPGIFLLDRNNSARANLSLSRQQTLATWPSAQSGYVELWEGKLFMQNCGDHMFITRLKGFKRVSASKSLAVNWPSTMPVLLFASKVDMNDRVRQHTGKADFLIFWALDEHAFLNSLEETNLCAEISLPSQTLFLYAADLHLRLIGVLLSHEPQRAQPLPQQQAQPPTQLQQQQPLSLLQLLLQQPLTRPHHLLQQPLSWPQQQQQPLQQLPQQPQRAQPPPQLQPQQQAQPPMQLQQLLQQPLTRPHHLLQQPLSWPQQQQPQRLLKRQHENHPIEQSKIPRIQQHTQHTQWIPQMQQPIIETAVDQAYMQVAGRSPGLSSIPEEALLIERDNELDN